MGSVVSPRNPGRLAQVLQKELEMQKPEKPKHYVRDQVIIVVISFFVMAVLLYFDYQHFTVFIPLSVYFIASGFWFGKYNAKLRDYDNHIARQRSQIREAQRIESMKGGNVNENIARYNAMLRERRANAKWWQFWI